MSKTLIKINDDLELNYNCDGFIIGMEGYSISFDNVYNIEEIKKIVNNNPDKDIFVAFNRMIFNSELSMYKETLLKIDKVSLKGIIVNDIAALTYNLNNNVILDQKHLNNSYLSINHYINNGVKGAILTNDITIDEISEIKANTKAILFKQVFGLPHLSTSVRRLVTNYLDYFKIDKKSKLYYICENNSDKYYHVKEDYFGTHIYGDKVLNILDKNIDVDYVILDSYLLNKENFKEVFNMYMNKEIDMNKINDMFTCDDGFINRKTVYKVKNNE